MNRRFRTPITLPRRLAVCRSRRAVLYLLAGIPLAGCLPIGSPEAPSGPPSGMASIAVNRSGVLGMLTTTARLDVNGTKVADLAVTDDYAGTVAPGFVVISVSSGSAGGRYSYRFKADAGKTYRFVVAPQVNITPEGKVAGPGQATETGGAFGIAFLE